MASKRAQIADAVVTALNGGTYAQDFTAGRKYVPLISLDALGVAGFTATVWIGQELRTMYNRATTRKDLDIHIGLESRIQPTTKPDSTTPADVAELDTLLEAAEQVAAALEPLGKASPDLGTTGARWTKTIINDPYSPDALREERVFASGLVLTYCYL